MFKIYLFTRWSNTDKIASGFQDIHLLQVFGQLTTKDFWLYMAQLREMTGSQALVMERVDMVSERECCDLEILFQ